MAKGKGKNGLVDLTGGLYEGTSSDVGAYQAKENPLAFYNHALANEGRTALNSSPFAWDYLQNQGFNNIFSGYEEGLARDKNLTFLNHMASTYGVSPSMSAANPFAGSSALAPVVVDQQFGLGGKKKRRRR